MCGIKTTNFLTILYLRNSNEKKIINFLHKVSTTMSKIKKNLKRVVFLYILVHYSDNNNELNSLLNQ